MLPAGSPRSAKKTSRNEFNSSTPSENPSSSVLQLFPLSCGPGQFSRILSLHAWLQSTCNAHFINSIDNFNLFWNRKSFLKLYGLHPNKLRSRILAANFKHAVHNPPRDWLFTPCMLPSPSSSTVPVLAHQNTHSLKNKALILNDFITDHNLDFLCLTETWHSHYFSLNQATTHIHTHTHTSINPASLNVAVESPQSIRRTSKFTLYLLHLFSHFKTLPLNSLTPAPLSLL